MKIINKASIKSWKMNRKCEGCASLLEIEASDIVSPAPYYTYCYFECCICNKQNVCHVPDLIKDAAKKK